MRNYLITEDQRNRHNHATYERFLRRALHAQGECAVLIAHHLTFTLEDGEPNEIPSADCMMFDHELMRAAFGETWYREAMMQLAMLPSELRAERLDLMLDIIEKEDRNEAARRQAEEVTPA